MFEILISLLWNVPPIGYAVVALATVLLWSSRSSVPGNLPPFPEVAFPIIGHAWSLRKNQLAKLHEWKSKVGDVYSLKMGPGVTVVLNSYKVIKEAFVKHGEYFSNRPHRFVDTDPRFQGGIIDTSGPLWKEQRGVAMTILKNFGMGKNWIGEKVNIEVKIYLDGLSKLMGKSSSVQLLTSSSVSNVTCTILIGHRFEHDDPYFQNLLTVFNEHVGYLRHTSIIKCFPWLKHLPGDLFHAKKMLAIEDVFRLDFSTKYINKIKDDLKNGVNQQNFINSYLAEKKSRDESGQTTTLNDQNLTMVVTNIIQAGTETTGTTIMWGILYALHHPDIQQKMYEEILDVVGTERMPCIEDKPNMNYVAAFILETWRASAVGPLGLPHQCIKTTTIGGYTIPAGSTVISDLYSALHDDTTWKDPGTFKPERFLDKNNLLTVPEEFIPFSIGRRFCMGEALAKTAVFLFMAGIIQRFQIIPEDPDNLPSLEPEFGISSSPKPYKVRFVQREC